MIIVGVDPGIVHTGAVRVSLMPGERVIFRACKVVDGLDMQAVADWIKAGPKPDLAAVEKYNPRGSLSSNTEMVGAEKELRMLVPAIKRIDNTGILKTVPTAVLQTLGLWDFPVRTHHQDLRSASRILVRAMMQDTVGNGLLAAIVRDRVQGGNWTIVDWQVD